MMTLMRIVLNVDKLLILFILLLFNNNAKAQQSNSRLIVIGDSIAVGLGSGNPEKYGFAPLLYRNDDHLYPEYANRDLVHLLGADMQYISVAHSGDTTYQIKEQLHRLQLSPSTDSAGLAPFPVSGLTIVVLSAGGNDIGRQIRPYGDYLGETLRQGLANLHDILAFFADKQRFKGPVVVFVSTIYDVTDGTGSAYACSGGFEFPGIPQAFATWRSAYADLVNNFQKQLPVFLVDSYRLFLGHGFHFADQNHPYYNEDDPSLWLSDRDCIHPNNRGHHELRAAFYRTIANHIHTWRRF